MQMKTSNLIYIFPLFFLLFFSCDGNNVIFPSKIVTNSVKVIEEFNEIEVSNGIHVNVVCDHFIERAFIEAPENLHPYIEVYNEADKLVIRKKDNIQFGGDYSIVVNLTVGKLNVVAASGGSRINIKHTLKVDDFVVQLSGGSRLNADLDCVAFSALTSGGSALQLSGKTSLYVLRSIGGSHAKSYNLTAETLKCHLSGGSRLEVNVLDSLYVEASGGSFISYSGGGAIQSQTLSGGADIKYAD